MTKAKGSHKRKELILVRQVHEVYDRVMYREAAIPSCQSRRLLQRYVDGDGTDESLAWIYENFVEDLLERSILEQRMLLSEIVVSWILQEWGPMMKSAARRRVRIDNP